MASPILGQGLLVEPLPETPHDKFHSLNNNNLRHDANVSLNLQVQSSAVSQQSSDRASSGHTGTRSGLDDDRILPLSDSHESSRPSLIAESAAWQKKYILTLDGGGVRGYSTLLIIQELMKICGSLEKRDDPDATSSYYPIPFVLSQGSTIIPDDRQRSARYLPVHYFDYIAGTSTGGLIAIMLSRLRMNVDDCIAEYTKLGEQIFGNQMRLFHIQHRIFSLRGPIPWNREKYDYRDLENAVQEVVDKRLNVSKDRAAGQMFPSHESRCRTMVIAVKENSASRAPYIFRTYGHEHGGEFVGRNHGPADDVKIVDVARATTAAPTYFKEKVIGKQRFLDGGFGTNANNPSLIAYHEVLLMHGNNPQAIGSIVSIGTGKLRNVTPFPKVNSIAGKYKAAINYAVHAASDAEDVHRSMLQDMSAIKCPYERYNVDGGLDQVKLGDWKLVRQRSTAAPVNVTLKTIEDATKAYLEQRPVRRRLERTAEMLVRNRQERSRTSAWNYAATGHRYYCSVSFCLEAHIIYNNEKGLRDHLVAQHADAGYRYPASTDHEKTLLERTIQRGKILHGD